MTARHRSIASLFERGRSRSDTVLFGLSIAVLVAHWAVIFWYVVPRIGELGFVRLHYTAALGVDWIGPWWMLFSFPAFGLAVLAINTSLARLLRRHERSLAVIPHAGTFLAEAALAFAGVAAVLLNG